MLKIKKIVCTIMALLLVFSLSGCYPENFISEDEEGDKLAKELMGYLSEDDAEGVKSMFCDRAKAAPELDQQIVEALEFFDGAVITENPHILVGSGKAMDEGRVTWLRVSPSIEEVETDSGKSYEILFYAYLVCAEEKDLVGISEVRIESSGGEVFTIGDYIEKA